MPSRKQPSDPQRPPTASPSHQVTAVASDSLLAIAEKLRTQDNRCTAQPMFCVQVLERIGPIIPEYADGNIMYHNHEEVETYYHDRPDPEEWARLDALNNAAELPPRITAGGYVEKWLTVQTCFTEDGCNRHLAANGHNYRHHFGTRIYVESFHRNPEMKTIRDSILATDLFAGLVTDICLCHLPYQSAPFVVGTIKNAESATGESNVWLRADGKWTHQGQDPQCFLKLGGWNPPAHPIFKVCGIPFCIEMRGPNFHDSHDFGSKKCDESYGMCECPDLHADAMASADTQTPKENGQP